MESDERGCFARDEDVKKSRLVSIDASIVQITDEHPFIVVATHT